MTPAKHNLSIYRGRDYSVEFEFRDNEGILIPIDTWSFKSEIKDGECIESNLLATFTIAVDIPNSRVILSLTDTETLVIPENSPAFWDLLVTIGTIDESYISGKVKILCVPTEV